MKTFEQYLADHSQMYASESEIRRMYEDECRADDITQTKLIARAPDMQAEIDRLKAINAELCAAINGLLSSLMPVDEAVSPSGRDVWPDIAEAIITARAALAKAQS